MSSPSKQHLRRTPRGAGKRNSDSGSPFNALHQLAGTINPTTPAAISSRPPLSANRASARRTPGGTYTGANAAPTTPHALRALQRRAATYTPGRDRRKSGRVQRETPMDILRHLGKVLAPTTRPVSLSPQEEPEKPPTPQPVDDLDEEPDLPRPRLSLPLTEMIVEDDGSPEIQPPRLSLAIEEDIDLTWRSIEMPRRERSIQDRTTLSRVSMGSNRFSDRFGDFSRMEDLEEEEPEYTMVHEDDGDDHGQDTGPVFDAGGETEDLRRFNLDFSFPTPDATTAGVAENQFQQEYEDFALDINPDVEAGFPSSDSVDGGGGIEFAIQDDLTRPAPPSSSPEPLPQEKTKGNKQQKLSRHGIPVPRLPSGIVKKLATRFARSGGGKSRISKDTLAAIEQATEWYFEQASDDLSTYAKHAGRKTIDETDVMTLMRRQRHIGKNTTLFALAQRHLPKELVQDIRLPKR
ncbi:hypothetical protein GX51_00624 [Blastomyces parvus]|uniref:CENP-T/Histone H4 histone fold domain-containing protein n=1 Tax=Blastomyces parvus TaxID=2060905 RepID=A0A2B7XKQ4_9EURO|nr:hypothetical protein GX51_00624 [Blastomyces parvus]